MRMFKQAALALCVLAALGTAGCGAKIMEENPSRVIIGKVSVPMGEEVNRADACVKLDFRKMGDEEIAFSREYEIGEHQTEVIVGDVPEGEEYEVTGAIYAEGSLEPVREFSTVCVAE
ncbi:MAG: hypothetical protein K6G50_11445 [bacterium]|nr:hypothetical protein [bacterium]